MKFILIFSIFVLFVIKNTAQTIVRFPQGSVVPDIIDPNVTVTNISFGPGISQTSCTAYVVCDGFDQNSAIEALNNGDYFEFTITPNAGYQINISTLSVLRTGSNLVGTPLIQMAIYYKKQSQSNFNYIAAYQNTSLGTNICSNSSSGNIPSVNVVTNEPITFRMVYYHLIPNNAQGRIGLVTVSGSIFLPVSLSSITASANINHSRISFSTASEINNAGFDIERSADGNDFEKIGWVDGHGTTSEEKQYTFIDERPESGLNYYRLRQVDYDGKFVYSEIVSVRFQKDDIHIYPNPATDKIVIDTDKEDHYTILNHMMSPVENGFLDASKEVFISGLRPGMYYVQISSRNELVRFVKW
jgi:hypothetical protein